MSNVKPIIRKTTTVHFDRVDFIQPSQGPNNDGRKISFRCMAGLMRSAEILVASKLFRYETVSELMRHALHRHIDELHAQEPSISTETFGFLESMVAQMQDELDGQKFKVMQDILTEMVGRYRAEGRDAMARKSVTRALKGLERSMDNSENAKYYWKRITKEHEALLGGRKVKLSEGV